jgi:hypothetical protein
LHRDVDLRILQTPRGARSGIAISGIDAKDGQHEIRSGEHGHSTAQKAAAEEVIARSEKAKLWSDSIVTELAPAGAFHEAEGYHQGYFERNPASLTARSWCGRKWRSSASGSWKSSRHDASSSASVLQGASRSITQPPAASGR